MAGSLGVLAIGPAAATTEVENVDGGPPMGVLAATTEVEDVDGGALGGCCRDFRQRPPPKLETLMAGLWVVPELEIRERPPPTLRNIDSELRGGAKAGNPGVQHLRSPPLGQDSEWLRKPRDKCSNSS
jgi:hypothetical protein